MTVLERQALVSPHRSSFGSLSLRVRYADQSPASDVGVWIADHDRNPPASALPPRTGRTNGDGALVLTELSPGPHQVHLDRCAGQSVTIVANQQTELELTIPEGPEVLGTVVDPNDRAVAGAEVRARRPGTDLWGRVLGTTDERGEFRFRGVQPGTHIWAAADRRACSLVHVTEGSTGARLALRLVLRGTARRVHGRVVDTRSAALGGAIVAFAAQDTVAGRIDRNGLQVRAPYPLLVRAGADGWFASDRVPPGRYLVFAQAPARADLAPAAVALVVDPYQDHEIELRLPRGATVFGRFVDGERRSANGRRPRARTAARAFSTSTTTPTPSRCTRPAPTHGRACRFSSSET